MHECTYDKDSEELAEKHWHSTSSMAGRFAARVGARPPHPPTTLALTHFSTRYELPRPGEPFSFDANSDDSSVAQSDALPIPAGKKKSAGELGREAWLAAQAEETLRGGGGAGGACKLCVICAEDFMTIKGNQFRTISRCCDRLHKPEAAS